MTGPSARRIASAKSATTRSGTRTTTSGAAGLMRRKSPRNSWPDYLRRRKWWIAGGIVVALILLIAAVLWWLHARHYESTDDAFIDTRIVTISAQISGAIGQRPGHRQPAGRDRRAADDASTTGSFRPSSRKPSHRSIRPKPTSPTSMRRSRRSRPASNKPIKQIDQAEAQLAFAKTGFRPLPKTRRNSGRRRSSRSQQAKSNAAAEPGQLRRRAGQRRRHAETAPGADHPARRRQGPA